MNKQIIPSINTKIPAHRVEEADWDGACDSWLKYLFVNVHPLAVYGMVSILADDSNVPEENFQDIFQDLMIQADESDAEPFWPVAISVDEVQKKDRSRGCCRFYRYQKKAQLSCNHCRYRYSRNGQSCRVFSQ